MKINLFERIILLLTVAALAFMSGYYVRGTVIRDTIEIETERMTALSESRGEDETVRNVLPDAPSSVIPLEENLMTPESSREQNPIRAVSGDALDLNTASLEDLETLPGIGPVLAERIIEYRERYGGFQSVEEIMYVSGIGEKTYAKIADLLKVEVER